jgi:hypothetical protein
MRSKHNNLTVILLMSIVNKVSESGIITIDPADFLPKGERVAIDLKSLLVEEFLLREKDFREYIKNHDWQQYAGKHVAVYCSNDALIPVWAYMLIGSALAPYATTVFQGPPGEMEKHLFEKSLAQLDTNLFRDARVVIKGCGDVEVPASAYMEITRQLRPVVKSIMYGEPCSTVPVYKSK